MEFMMSKLFRKYDIKKADGSPTDPNAQYFVLRIDTDPAARSAVRNYAESIARIDPWFSEELLAWVSRYSEASNKACSGLVVRCANCQEELRTSWKYCPCCGATPKRVTRAV